jgi:hypothetical protein
LESRVGLKAFGSPSGAGAGWLEHGITHGDAGREMGSHPSAGAD